MTTLLRLCLVFILWAPSLAYAAVLENPSGGNFYSGIGVISGWKCRVEGQLTVRFNGGDSIPLSYGSERPDTAGVCGDTNNGFVAIWNWARLDDGEHTAVAYDNGVEFDRSTFEVATTGEEFVEGASARVEVPDFPSPGESTWFEWNEATQHLEMVGLNSGSRVYWAISISTRQHTIHWARLDLSDAGSIDVTDIVGPERYIDKLAVDPMGGTLYMLTRTYSNYNRFPDDGSADLRYSYIYRASLDGSGFEEVFRFHRKFCADRTPCPDPGYISGDAPDITFDSDGRKLYITILESLTRMYRVDPGSARLEPVPGQFEGSSGEDGREWDSMAVGGDDELYLLSNNGKRLRRIWAMRRDGTGLRIVLNDHPHIIWHLAGVGAGRVYFTDQSSLGILSIAAGGGGEPRLEVFGGTAAPEEVGCPCTVVGGEIYMRHRSNGIIRVRLADNRILETYSGGDMDSLNAIAVLP